MIGTIDMIDITGTTVTIAMTVEEIMTITTVMVDTRIMTLMIEKIEGTIATVDQGIFPLIYPIS